MNEENWEENEWIRWKKRRAKRNRSKSCWDKSACYWFTSTRMHHEGERERVQPAKISRIINEWSFFLWFYFAKREDLTLGCWMECLVWSDLNTNQNVERVKKKNPQLEKWKKKNQAKYRETQWIFFPLNSAKKNSHHLIMFDVLFGFNDCSHCNV